MKVQSERCREFAKEREKGTKQPVSHCPNVLDVCVLSHVQLFAWRKIPWTVAHQAPLSMGFFRQKDWSGLPYPPPGDLPNPGIIPKSLA